MTAIDTSTFINNINATQSSSANQAEKNKDIGTEEFLTMLVAQLQNQDPLDPMSNEDFAVNLAQFSQLEQLISINNNLESSNQSSNGMDFSSVASYLGNEVVLDSSSVEVAGGEAGSICFDLEKDAAAVKVEFQNANGTTMGIVELTDLKSGRNSIDLGKVAVANGSYELKLTATSADGIQSNPIAYSSGLVDGYIPGANPALLVNGKEISLDSIKEVRVAKN